MDIESIASEIVAIRNRLEEIEGTEERGDRTQASDLESERANLMERLRHLQRKLSAEGTTAQDSPAKPESVHYLPPA